MRGFALSVSAALAALTFVAPAHAGDANPAQVARTGQTVSYAAGDDGDLEKGIAWPDPRFTDNGDGTVTDHLTGLVWLQDAGRFTPRGWNPALNACNNLGDDGIDLTDGSAAGDWRLPNSLELRSLIDFSASGPALPAGHPFTVPVGAIFWTGTTSTNNDARAWTIDDGTMTNDPKGSAFHVWPVRGVSDGPAPVPQTGQSASFGNRDDGQLQAGVAWPSPRFTDNLDGTVTDNLTGLIWLGDSTRFADLSWVDGVATCAGLADDGIELTDGSLPGEWRLPNIRELGSLTDFDERGPALPAGHPFIAANAETFWSSTTTAFNGNRAWSLGTGIGRIQHGGKNGTAQVWPVRGGNRVQVDIKPGSCANPFNLGSRGRTPVAIPGNLDLDVATIDPATLRLEGVAPVHASIEDVATYGLPGVAGACGDVCGEQGPDGIDDLVLNFSTQEIADALGSPGHGECIGLTLTGNLSAAYGGTPLEGSDVVLILTP